MHACDTVFPADALEFCPHPAALNLFVCGTYKLDEQPSTPSEPPRPQVRRGQCLVFQVADDDMNFHKIQAFDLPAVLDMKWCHMAEAASPLLGIADSEGNITLHTWNVEENHLLQRDSIRCAPKDTLCLSLDWAHRRNPSSTPHALIASLSSGSLSLLQPDAQGKLSPTSTWHAHDYEPWVASWDCWDGNIVYSGGDDLKLKAWDIRQAPEDGPTFVNKRFDAGITSIASSPHSEHIVAVGSYDASLRLFDMRSPHTALSHGPVGGGIWRAKWHPDPMRKEDILMACMHDGFKVVRCDPGWVDVASFKSSTPSMPPPRTIKNFNQHESLAYGVDWSYAPPTSNGETVIGSCSFYDHTMHLWSA